MNQRFGLRLEDLRAGADGGHVVIDVGRGLRRAHGREVVADADAMDQGRVTGAFELIAQRFLAADHHLQRRSVFGEGTDQQTQIGQGIRSDQVRLVEDEQGDGFALLRLIEDLQEQAVLAVSRRLAEGRDDQLEQPVAADMGEVDVGGLEAVARERAEEQLDQRGLAHARGAGHQGQGAVAGQVLQSGQALGDPLVLEDVRGRRVLEERLRGHLEVRGEHGFRSPWFGRASAARRGCRGRFSPGPSRRPA